ncbi:hypothetical protein MMC10_002921 [Thelotrema lepadinum]|nr:hypothetical protein [Thelotrema lepadinum]
MCIISNKLFCQTCNNISEADSQVFHCERLKRKAQEQPALWRHPDVVESSQGVRTTCSDLRYRIGITDFDDHCRNIALREQAKSDRLEEKRRLRALKDLAKDEHGTRPRSIKQPGFFRRMTSTIAGKPVETILLRGDSRESSGG